MIIKSVEKNCLASALGLQKGDDIISINNEPVRDVIDYQFHISDPQLRLKVRREREIFELECEKKEYDDLGIVFEEIKYRHCGSDCPFCFVDQNPQGLRKALYFRDEDFRLSFMHGSYFTLNNVSKGDLRRIIKQRLSPLYISVHALDRSVRNFLFGIERDDRLLEKIELLTDNDIELHTQVVLCPGINDGDILHDTIEGLEKFFPSVRSVALVPLGLTKYREGLFEFQTVTPDYARNLIPEIHALQKKKLKNLGERYVYFSDEWYLKAGKQLPSLRHYGDLFQLENGVGLTRQFIHEISKQKSVFKRPVSPEKKLTILTGTLAYPILLKYLVPVLEQAAGLSVKVVGVVNEFYGHSIDVSGLLSGSDFIRTINADDEKADVYLLPPNCLNPDGYTLDDETEDTIMKKTGQHVRRYSGVLKDICEVVESTRCN